MSRNVSPNEYAVVVGMPARDTKRFPDGAVAESLGGVLFSATAMAALCRVVGMDVVPVCNIGEDIADRATQLLASSGCRLDATRVVPETTQHSIITFTGPDERSEQVHGALPMLTFEDLAPWLDAALIAVNFITGAEMSLATFRELRARYSGPIVMDYHTLALATLPDGRRVQRRREDWAAWIECADVVQMNREEASTLAGHTLATANECAAFARNLLALGPSAVVITLDSSGAVAAQSAGVSRGTREHATFRQQAFPPKQVVDTVGSGDVFLAGLAVGWRSWRDVEPSMRLAAAAAGINCGYEGLSRSGTLIDAWRAAPLTSPA